LSENEVHEGIEEVIGNVGSSHDFLCSIDRQIVVQVAFNMLLAGVTCLKHQGFREEREWRAIYSPSVNLSNLMESTIQVVGGFPQVIHKIPLDKGVSPDLADLDFPVIFDRLIIGPSQYPWPMFEAFSGALLAAGVPDASTRVRVSDIPIRSV
jgi:hypothetical protein